MATIAQVQAAVKTAPHYRVTVGALEVIGAPGASRWSFSYIVRGNMARNERSVYGKQPAIDYLASIAADMPIENVTFNFRLADKPVGGGRFDRRAAMIQINRARAGYLRNRVWSAGALDVRAFHAFALTCDKDGNYLVERAAREFLSYVREAKHGFTNLRAAWLLTYGFARSSRGA